MDKPPTPQSVRAYSTILIKSFDDDERVIEGVASTPSTDRMDDIVESQGAKFKLPLKLLWQHDSRQPIGDVTWAKATPDGIPFRAVLTKALSDTPQSLRERLDVAWHSIKLGLVRAVSIGFKPIEWEPIDAKDPWGGRRFKTWEWFELSAVTIPANVDATISNIRSFDRANREAATGQLPGAARDLAATEMAATGRTETTQPAPRRPTIKAQESKMKKTIAEQISAFEATRQAKAARRDALMDDASDKGETLAPADKEEYETLNQEIKEIDEHLVRLREREADNKTRATPVPEHPAQAQVQRATSIIRVNKAKLEKGTNFFRYSQVMMMARGNKFEAAQLAQQNQQWMQESPELVDILKTAVAAGTTSDSAWAGSLVNYTVMVSEFIELLRGQAILGRLTGFRRVPFNVKVPRQTAGTSVNWVGEGAAKPLTKGAFDTVQLTWSKVAGIVAFTQELVRFSNPSAEAIIRQDLTAAVTQFLDEQFLDTSKTEVAGVSPASVTNGSDSITASGETALAFRNDFKAAIANFILENLDLNGVVILMKPLQAVSLGLLVNATTSQPEFPGLTAAGGAILGFPVITSNNCPSGKIIFIAPGEILLADDGGVDISVSTEASLQMDDNPTDDATSLVSLWQNNMIGLRVERFVNWKKRRHEAVVYITGADYGGVGTGT